MDNLNLSEDEQRKLKKLLGCVAEKDYANFAKLASHAQNIDYMMKVVDSFAMVSGLSKKFVVWLVVLVGGIATLTGHLGEWVKGLFAALLR